MTSKITCIDQKWLDKNRIEKLPSTVEYLGAKGMPKGLKLTQQSIHLVNHVTPVGESAMNFAKNIGTATKVLGVARIIPDTADAVEAVKNLAESPNSRTAVQAFSDVTGAVSTWGGAALFVAGTPVLGVVAEATGIASTVTGLGLDYSDYSKAAKLETEASHPEQKKAVTHSKNYYFYKTIKNVASLALTILGIAVILTGLELMPVIALTLFMIFTICLAIQVDLLKESGDYKVIKFDQDVQLASI